MQKAKSDWYEALREKYDAIGQDVEAHLEGLLHSAPITYWDYIQTDTLLTLQKQRTVFPDEMVFIMYHQINELLFKMILWEIQQVAYKKDMTASFFAERLGRVSRYFDMLSSSFDIMKEGMDVKQYQQFRYTLTPASGFQSAQYRLIEFASTELINLIDARFRDNINRKTPFEHAYNHLYWQAAGRDHKTGEKSTLIQFFEDKYKGQFLEFMEEYNSRNLWTKYKSLDPEARNNPELIKAMRHYDKTVNISWVMSHLKAAEKYLQSGDEVTEATGGSDWKKYMHPKYQRRIFFPDLWSEEELKNWGK